jgi:uncharacterized protein YjiS (DUF1127 family)
VPEKVSFVDLLIHAIYVQVVLMSTFATLGDLRRIQMSAIHFEVPRHRLGAVPHHRGRRVAGVVARQFFTTLRQWRRRAHDRAELASLDDRMLRDIGLTRADAEFLSNKPFWRE